LKGEGTEGWVGAPNPKFISPQLFSILDPERHLLQRAPGHRGWRLKDLQNTCEYSI
jgi:hypothetical protein